ncbi:MAG: hypothetical protein A2Y62_01760 [Candidatus Fischerbacteria bacterium RBG_13_37_8]|uniref:Plasmid stabilization protein n=1 Tax=Candidatus Fischerbacteria bacterium RBG_13_37_8 TaxID=1817863 RepID=A0A1F5VDM5_9BACT|nr:MAG: hypothetical protein A2Y62_01760 [Candidatus Fischerbacteria bacterium RBG_13_37_8]
MKFRIEKSFARDVDKIYDKRVLKKLRTIISMFEKVETIYEIPHVKKMEGYNTYYRIKISDYRLGIEMISTKEAILVRFLHRKDIYKYFPRKKQK